MKTVRTNRIEHEDSIAARWRQHSTQHSTMNWNAETLMYGDEKGTWKRIPGTKHFQYYEDRYNLWDKLCYAWWYVWNYLIMYRLFNRGSWSG